MTLLAVIAQRIARTLLLMLIAAAGTILLVRLAPGYFADASEMDARYAQAARVELELQGIHQQSVTRMVIDEAEGWLRGDFGESRQYNVPVSSLIKARIAVSSLLLTQALLRGWLLALCVAFPISALRRGGYLWGAPFTILLAIPTSAMATACILVQAGGPVLVLTLLIAAREFKFLRSLLAEAWQAPHILQGRAQGMTSFALARAHIVPNVALQLGALAALSIVTTLGALVPIEVIFTVPGVGQLAWSAVMNRDMPVLAAVSLLMAVVVGITGLLTARRLTLEGI